MQPVKQSKRAHALRTRLFDARISVVEAARRLEVTRVHLSYVLNGHRDSNPLLDRVEAMLAESTN